MWSGDISETVSDTMKQEYETYMRITPCKACKGMRLKKEALAVTVCDKNIYEITSMPIRNLHEVSGRPAADAASRS